MTLPLATDPLVIKVASEIKHRDSIQKFINSFAVKYGYPVWDKAVIKTELRDNYDAKNIQNTIVNGNDTLIYIPLVLENMENVNGYILADISDSIYLSLHLSEYYKAYPFGTPTSTDSITAEKFALQIMSLDKNVFGYNEFVITDKRLFNYEGRDTSTFTTSIKFSDSDINQISGKLYSSTNNLYHTVCVFITTSISTPHCGTPNYPGCIEGCDQCIAYCSPISTLSYNSICESWWDGGLDGGSGSGGSTGSGGGGTIPPSYPCIPGLPPIESFVNENPLPPCPPPAPGTGWTPVTFTLAQKLNYLSTFLSLTPLEKSWLENNSIRVEEMFIYLLANNTGNRAQILKTHLLYLMQYPEFVNFVTNHRIAFPNEITMWWENKDWVQANINQIPNIPFLYVDENMFDPGINLQKFMNCFGTIPDAGATYQVKLCVDIPVNGHPTWAFNPSDNFSPGHVFLTLTKTNGTQSISQTVGFYPTGGAISPGTFKNDGEPGDGHEYNASLTINSLPASGFNTVVQNLLTHQNEQYNLENNNCANPAIQAFNSVISPPIVLPSYEVVKPLTVPVQILSMQQSPQRLYQYIQNFVESSQISKQIGVKLKATNSYGSCN
ncbi:MAG: hypothetical protein ACOYLO_05915 [Ferruginibacter sp.]